jgi:hypothetical protein
MIVDFYAFVADVEQRQRDLGIDQSAEATERLRNKGGRRTPEKRAMLARMATRAEAAGRNPVLAYY